MLGGGGGGGRDLHRCGRGGRITVVGCRGSTGDVVMVAKVFGGYTSLEPTVCSSGPRVSLPVWCSTVCDVID